MNKQLTDSDVYYLIGDAELKREKFPDICIYEYDLAERISLAIGNQALADRVIEVKKACDGMGGFIK